MNSKGVAPIDFMLPIGLCILCIFSHKIFVGILLMVAFICKEDKYHLLIIVTIFHDIYVGNPIGMTLLLLMIFYFVLHNLHVKLQLSIAEYCVALFFTEIIYFVIMFMLLQSSYDVFLHLKEMVVAVISFVIYTFLQRYAHS